MCKIFMFFVFTLLVHSFLYSMQKWTPRDNSQKKCLPLDDDIVKCLKKGKYGSIVTQNHRYWYEGEEYHCIQEVWTMVLQGKNTLFVDTCCNFPRYNSPKEYKRARLSYALIQNIANACNCNRIRVGVSFYDWSKHFVPKTVLKFSVVKGLPFDDRVIIMENKNE